MSEDINITGADWDDNRLPKWATEKTQEQILKTTQRSLRVTQDQLKELQKITKELSDGLKKNTKETSERLRNLSSEIQEGNKADAEQRRKDRVSPLHVSGRAGQRQDAVTGVDHNDNIYRDFKTGLADTASELTGLSGSMNTFNTGPFRNFSGMLGKITKKLGKAGSLLGLAGNLLGRGISLYRDQVNVLRTLNEVGIVMEGTYVDVSRQLVELGMTTEQFEKVMTRTSGSMVTFGTRTLANVTRQTEELVGGFQRFGLTQAEATEYTAELLEQQRLAGVFTARSDAQRAKAFNQSISELTAFSRILGVSREQLLKQNTELLGQADISRRLFTMEEEERANASSSLTRMNAVLNAIPGAGQEMAKLFADMSANIIPESSEAFQRLVAASPELAHSMAELSKKVMSGAEITDDELLHIVESFGSNLEGRGGLLDILGMAGGELAGTANLLGQFGLNLENVIGRFRRGELDLSGAVDGNVQTVTGLQTSLDRLRQAFDYVVVHFFDNIFTLFGGTDSLDKVSSGLTRITEALMSFAENMEKPDWWQAQFKRVFDIMGSALKESMPDLLPMLGKALIGGIAVMFTGPFLMKLLRFIPGPIGIAAAAMTAAGTAHSYYEKMDENERPRWVSALNRLTGENLFTPSDRPATVSQDDEDLIPELGQPAAEGIITRDPVEEAINSSKAETVEDKLDELIELTFLATRLQSDLVRAVKNQEGLM